MTNQENQEEIDEAINEEMEENKIKLKELAARRNILHVLQSATAVVSLNNIPDLERGVSDQSDPLQWVLSLVIMSCLAGLDQNSDGEQFRERLLIFALPIIKSIEMIVGEKTDLTEILIGLYIVYKLSPFVYPLVVNLGGSVVAAKLRPGDGKNTEE